VGGVEQLLINGFQGNSGIYNPIAGATNDTLSFGYC